MKFSKLALAVCLLVFDVVLYQWISQKFPSDYKGVIYTALFYSSLMMVLHIQKQPLSVLKYMYLFGLSFVGLLAFITWSTALIRMAQTPSLKLIYWALLGVILVIFDAVAIILYVRFYRGQRKKGG